MNELQEFNLSDCTISQREQGHKCGNDTTSRIGEIWNDRKGQTIRQEQLALLKVGYNHHIFQVEQNKRRSHPIIKIAAFEPELDDETIDYMDGGAQSEAKGSRLFINAV